MNPAALLCSSSAWLLFGNLPAHQHAQEIFRRLPRRDRNAQFICQQRFRGLRLVPCQPACIGRLVDLGRLCLPGPIVSALWLWISCRRDGLCVQVPNLLVVFS